MVNLTRAVITAIGPTLRRCCTYGKYSASTCIEWNDKTTFIKKRSRPFILAVKISLLLSVSYCIAQIYLLVKSDASVVDKLQAGFFALLLGAANLIQCNDFTDTEPCKLINAARTNPKKGSDGVKKKYRLLPEIAKVVVGSFEPSSWLIILFYTASALFTPCEIPMVVGPLILEQNKCQEPLGWSNLLIRIFIAGMEFGVYSNAMWGGIFYSLSCLFLQIIIFWIELLDTLTPDCSKWEMLERYRVLQVWENIMNNIIKSGICVFMFIQPGLQILLASSIVLFYTNMSNFQLALFIMLLVNEVIFALFILSGASEAYKKSRK